MMNTKCTLHPFASLETPQSASVFRTPVPDLNPGIKMTESWLTW